MLSSSTLLPLLIVLRSLGSLAAIGAAAMFFKPLLLGLGRALVLVVRPRLTKEERRGRRAMRDAKLLQRMINNSQGPSHAAELRAMAARS
jgi:hypothetical protein